MTDLFNFGNFLYPGYSLKITFISQTDLAFSLEERLDLNAPKESPKCSNTHTKPIASLLNAQKSTPLNT